MTIRTRTRQQRRAMVRALKKMRPTLDPRFLFAWHEQVWQYPEHGPVGVGYFRGEVPADRQAYCGPYVDCLLYRGENGDLLGILNHYPVDCTLETAGSVNTWVHPEHWGKGIATALHAEANRRWAIDYTKQRFTPAGLAFTIRFLEKEQTNDEG